MMFFPIFLATIFSIFYQNTSPNWQKFDNVTSAHLRGLSVVNDDIVWASGYNGTVIKTIDGGKNWEEIQIPSAEKFDLRDIQAFDKDTAYVMAAGEIGVFYKTTDGGKTWAEIYKNTTKGIFFDGFSFWNKNEGIAYSDPICGKLFLVKTDDGGVTWEQINPENLPKCLEGEAGFAASGTGISVNGDNIRIASGGGKKARVFYSSDRGNSWSVSETPLLSNSDSGIFSINFWDKNNGIAIGGSYIDSTRNTLNCAITADGGKNWQLIEKFTPNGYRSCVTKHPTQNIWIATGRTGTDISRDGGKTWQFFSKNAYYTCAFSEKYLWLSGKNGRLAKVLFQSQESRTKSQDE